MTEDELRREARRLLAGATTQSAVRDPGGEKVAAHERGENPGDQGGEPHGPILGCEARVTTASHAERTLARVRRMSELLSVRSIAEDPGVYVRRHGMVIDEFGHHTQD